MLSLCVSIPLAHAGFDVSGSDDGSLGGTISVTADDSGVSVTGSGNSVQVKGDDVSVKTEGASVSSGERNRAEVRMEDGSGAENRVRVEYRAEEGDDHATGTIRAMERADEHAMEALNRLEFRLKFGDEMGKGTGTEVRTRAEVRTGDDFQSFIEYTAKEDAHLKRVEVKEGKVNVEYDQPAKLFGFIGTTVRARASADIKGNVEVSYPWYHIFMKKQQSSASIQSNIARALAAERKMLGEGVGTTTAETTIAAGLGIPDIFDVIASTLRWKEASVSKE